MSYFSNDGGTTVNGWTPASTTITKQITADIATPTTIAANAFYNQGLTYSLTNLILPTSLTTIGSQAFNLLTGESGITGTINLDSLTNLNTIETKAFRNCKFTGTLTLPSSLTTLATSAFAGLINLNSLDLSNLTITSLEEDVFSTGGISTLLLPDTLESIGKNTFYNCSKLEVLNLKNVISLSDQTFDFVNVGSLTNIYFNKNITINYNSFHVNRELTVYGYKGNSVTILNSSGGSSSDEFDIDTNPLDIFFDKWILYDYPYPETTSCYSSTGYFTLSYDTNIDSVFYTYSPTDKPYNIYIDGNLVVFDQSYSEYRVTFTGKIPHYSKELYIDGNGPMLLKDETYLRIYQPEETTLVDVNKPFAIVPHEPPYTLYFDGKSEPLTELRFNQYSFTIFENNVHIEGGGLSSTDLTLTPYFKHSRMYYGSIIYTLEPDIPATVQLVDASTGEPIGDPVEATGSYYINNLRAGRYYLRIVNGPLSYDHTIISDICFIKGTLVKTDQGYIEIDKITNQTLHRKPITVTKTIHHDPYLVKVSANAFGQFPTRDTYMSLKHKIILEAPIMAKNLINDDTIIEVPYDGEPLYNVLVDTHTTMKVNGMLVETLDPNSIVGLFYRAKLSPKQKQKMIQMINEDPIKAKSILTVL